MSAYYNDNEPFVCAWMQNLMEAGLITRGVIDNRPIQEVRTDEIKDYERCHFFAGIAGWDYALQLAGWPADRPVWTASLPCQPFSVAGRQKAERDDRHLWPVFYDLVCQCRPVTIFGEQVEAAVRLGWIDRVRADLDRAGYAFGFVVLGAHSVGAPHIRQRIYWVAHSTITSEYGRTSGGEQSLRDSCDAQSGYSGLPDSPRRRIPEPQTADGRQGFEGSGGMGDGHGEGLRRVGVGEGRQDTGSGVWIGNRDNQGPQGRRLRPEQESSQRSAWSSGSYIQCADGKARLVEPSICPLVDGLSDCLDGLRSIEAISIERIREYGARNKRDADETLRMVQEAVQSEACWQGQATRMRFQLPSPEVLLDYLLCLKTALGRAANESGGEKESAEAKRRIMRSVCYDSGNVHSPHRRQSDEQQAVESTNTLLALSFVLARDSESYRAKAVEANAASCRVGLLRGAGNAIVAAVAAEFIRAFMESA